MAVFVQRVAVQRPAPVEVLSGPVAWFLTGGRSSTAATAVWASTVLHSVATPPGRAEALLRGIDTAAALDGAFVAPPAYGARLLLRAGDLPGSLRVLEQAHERFPRDPWFPWLIGMQLWKEADRPTEAAPWLRIAAELDPDGDVHQRAADLAERGLP